MEIDGTVVLPPVSFTLSPGQLGCVTGANGTGKSTLLRVFLGTRGLSAGSYAMDGGTLVAGTRAFRREVAALVDGVPVARDLTVAEQMTLVATSWWGNTRTTAAQVAQTQHALGLTRLTGRLPHQLSAGQRQLLVLALTLVRPARFLLLDEPELNLDAAHVAAVVRLLRERADQGTTVLMATHDNAIVTACDHEVRLSDSSA